MFRLLRRLFHRHGVVLLAVLLTSLVCYRASAAHVENVPVTVQLTDGTFGTVLQPRLVADFFDLGVANYGNAFFDAGPRFVGNRVFVNGVQVFHQREFIVRPVFRGRRW